MSSTTEKKYFEAHPEARSEVVKSYFAYHTTHIRDSQGAHNFSGPWRDCECLWCGRSRELVRWDDLPARCMSRPQLPDIEDTISAEEEIAFALADRATLEVPRLVAQGATLAVLHHTHGYDPDTVSGIVEVSPQAMQAYETDMAKERSRSRGAVVRKVVTIDPTVLQEP